MGRSAIRVELNRRVGRYVAENHTSMMMTRWFGGKGQGNPHEYDHGDLEALVFYFRVNKWLSKEGALMRDDAVQVVHDVCLPRWIVFTADGWHEQPDLSQPEAGDVWFAIPVHEECDARRPRKGEMDVGHGGTRNERGRGHARGRPVAERTHRWGMGLARLGHSVGADRGGGNVDADEYV